MHGPRQWNGASASRLVCNFTSVRDTQKIKRGMVSFIHCVPCYPGKVVLVAFGTGDSFAGFRTGTSVYQRPGGRDGLLNYLCNTADSTGCQLNDPDHHHCGP